MSFSSGKNQLTALVEIIAITISVCFTFLFSTGCSAPIEELSPPAVTINVLEPGFCELELHPSGNLRRVMRLNQSGQVQQRWQIATGLRRVLILEPPPPAGAFDFRFELVDGSTFEQRLNVPAPPSEVLSVRLDVPMGLATEATTTIQSLPYESKITAALTLDNRSSEPCTVKVKIVTTTLAILDFELDEGKPLEPLSSHNINVNITLHGLERKQLRLGLNTPNIEFNQGEISVRVQFHDSRLNRDEIIERKQQIMFIEPKSLQDTLVKVNLAFPTDQTGLFDPTRAADTIVLPTPLLARIRRSLGYTAGLANDETPYAYQTLTLQNLSTLPINLAVKTQIGILDVKSEKLVSAPGFRLPELYGAASSEVSRLVSIPNNSTQAIVLPVFVETDVLPGRYTRRISWRLLGSDRELGRADAELQILQTNIPLIMLTLLAFIITLIATPLLLWHAKNGISRFTTLELVQIGLFATAAFVTVSIPSTVFSTLLFAFFPIFSPFILGLFSEIMGAAIAASLYTLVARPGVALLYGGTRFLLSGLVFGGLSPLGLLYVIPNLLLLEGILWAFGITRHQTISDRLKTASNHKRMITAFALFGFVNAFMQITLGSTLLRLYYAEWYIMTFMALNGCLYPALGAYFGSRLGRDLLRTAE